MGRGVRGRGRPGARPAAAGIRSHSGRAALLQRCCRACPSEQPKDLQTMLVLQPVKEPLVQRGCAAGERGVAPFRPVQVHM
jgi:hypothetical protein